MVEGDWMGGNLRAHRAGRSLGSCG